MPAAGGAGYAGASAPAGTGPNLTEIRRRQEANRVREVYDVGHEQRLAKIQSHPPPNLPSSKVLCSTEHGPGCTVCQTCHFCRQKTIDPKTFCGCGDAAGIWCGKCLDIRMGENIHKVLPLCEKGEWSCPVCRDLCNCSGHRCLRLSRGWEPTSQLAFEAKRYGYRSVAHYLVLTALDKSLPISSAMPLYTGRYMPRPSRGMQQQQQQAETAHSRRRQQAQQELADMRKACQAQLQSWAGLRQEVAHECDMGLDVLGAGAGEEEEEEEELLRLRLSPAAEVAGPGVPPPLFRGAGGSAAEARPNQRQQQQRVGSVEPQQGAAPPAAGGVSNTRPGAQAAAAAAASGEAAGSAEPRVMGLSLPLTDLGVLGIRGCTPAHQPAAAGNSPGADAAQRQQAGGSGGQAAGSRPLDAAGGIAEQTGSIQGRQHSMAMPGTAGGNPGQWWQQQQQQRGGRQQQQQPKGALLQQQHAVPAAAAGFAAGDFGADDLPGAEAPGYRDASNAAELRPRRQPRFSASRAPSAASRGHARQRTVGAQSTAHLAGRPMAAAAAGRTSPDLMEGSVLSPRDSRPGSASAARAAGTSSSFAAGTAAAAAEAASAMENEDVILVELTQMHSTAAGAAAAAAMAEPALSDGDGDPHPKRSRPSEAASSPRRRPVTQPGQLDSTEFVASEANSPLDQAERMQRELLLLMRSHPGVSPLGLPYEELCERLKDLMDVAFGDWSDQRAGTLIQDGTGATGSLCSLETLRRACRLLVFLANYAPLEADRDPSCDDIVRRLSNNDFFVDFKSSGCDARQELINTAREILEVFSDRQKPYSAVEMAYIAQGSPEPDPGYASTVQLAGGALSAVKLARQGMAETVQCLLGWMAVLHEEATEVQGLLTTPQDLLQKHELGPIQWAGSNSLPRQEWAHLSEMQRRQEEVERREVRRMQLETLQCSNGIQTAVIAMCLSTVAPSAGAAQDNPPRALAKQVLESVVMPQVLCLDVNYPAEVRGALYTMVARLLHKAAPDLQHPSAWQVGMSDMRQALRGLSRQPQELQQLLPGQPPPASSEQLWAQAEDLLLHVMGEQLAPAARQQELSELYSNVGQQLRDPVEELVTAEYQIRSAGPDNKVKPFGRNVSNWQRESRQVGTIKIDVLAALYALQLQAGQSWQHVQALVVQPYDDLTSFFARRSPDQRRFVLYLASQIVRSAPSLLQWDATAASSSIPAVDLLRLWLRSMLDQHPAKAFGKCMEHVTRVLARAPATEQLFSVLSAQLQPGVLQDIFQRDCGIVQSGDQRAKLLKVVLERLRDSRGEAALKQTLQELLRVLAPWQKQKDSEDPSSIIKAIRWQRTCLLSLLQLTQLVLQYPALDATVSLTELVNTATKWLQDGIKAVCGQLVEQKPAKEKAAGQVAAKPVAAASEEDSPRGIININRPDARYVQASALQHLAPYLGLVVRLAGHAGQLEGTPTSMWPAAAVTSSSSSSGQLLSAAVQNAHPKAGQLPPGAASSLRRKPAGLFCLRDLLGTVLSLMGGEDQLGEHDNALLSHFASALAQQSGLLPGLADPQGLLKGYSSPGLLHYVLNVHVQAALRDAELGTDMAVHRGVNALHLVSRLLDQLLQPGAGDPQLPLLHACTQQLLLPCLANPLVKLAEANMSSAGCCRMQLHVYRLLQQLLGEPLGQQLLPPPGQQQQGGGEIKGGDGALRKMTPIPQPDLQQIMYHLMRLSLRSCLLVAAAATKTDASALHTVARPTSSAASQVQFDDQQHQQEPPQCLQQLFCTESDGTKTVLLRLLGWARHVAATQHPPIGKVAAPPADTCWRALEAGIRFAVQLVQQHGAAREAVTDIMFPAGACGSTQRSIYHVMCKGRAGVKAAYTALVQQLPPYQQQQWRLPEVVAMPPPESRPQQQQQQQQQQQPRRPSPPPPHPPQPQGAANLPAARESSQACSQAGGPARVQYSAGNVACRLEPSQMPYSQVGGKVASCAVRAGGLVDGAAMAGAQRKRAGSPVAAAGQGDRDDAEVSSGPQHKKQRVSNAAVEQQRKHHELPDVFSQDQGPSQGIATQPQPHVQHDGPQQVQEQQQQQREQRVGQEIRQLAVPQQPPHQPGQEKRQGLPPWQAGHEQQQELPPPQQQPTEQQHPPRPGGEQQQQPRSQQQGEQQQQQVPMHPGRRESRSRSGSGDSASQAGNGSMIGYLTNAGRPPGSTLPKVYVANAPLIAKADTPAEYDYCAELSGKLETSFDKLKAKRLLKVCGKILITKMHHSDSDQPDMQQTAGSELLVDPDAAAAAGVMYSEQQRSVWVSCWRRLEGPRRRSEGKGRSASQGTLTVQPVWQQLPQGHAQQQQQPRQQPREQPQPRQLHHQQGSADAAAMPGVSRQLLPRPDALREAEPAAGQAEQTNHAAAAAGQADGEAAGQPQAGTREPQAAAGVDLIEDSQATIKYPTLPSQW